MVEFTGHATLRENIIAALAPMIPELISFKPIWDKISDQKKIDWLIDGKSMFISAAGGLYIYLRPFFKSLDNEIDRGDIELRLDTFTLRRPEDVD